MVHKNARILKLSLLCLHQAEAEAAAVTASHDSGGVKDNLSSLRKMATAQQPPKWQQHGSIYFYFFFWS
jgi:hypothetical protein